MDNENFNYDEEQERRARKNNRRKTKIGLVRHIYAQQKTRCRDRKRSMPEYSSDELLNWMLSNPRYTRLYDNWKESKFALNLRPTIDRVNPLQGYKFSNIQILTYEQNVRKGNSELILTKGVPVIQKTLEGKIINKFNSLKEAGEKTGVNSSNICNACKGKLKTYKGFIWEYNYG